MPEFRGMQQKIFSFFKKNIEINTNTNTIVQETQIQTQTEIQIQTKEDYIETQIETQVETQTQTENEVETEFSSQIQDNVENQNDQSKKLLDTKIGTKNGFTAQNSKLKRKNSAPDEGSRKIHSFFRSQTQIEKISSVEQTVIEQIPQDFKVQDSLDQSSTEKWKRLIQFI